MKNFRYLYFLRTASFCSINTCHLLFIPKIKILTSALCCTEDLHRLFFLGALAGLPACYLWPEVCWSVFTGNQISKCHTGSEAGYSKGYSKLCSIYTSDASFTLLKLRPKWQTASIGIGGKRKLKCFINHKNRFSLQTSQCKHKQLMMNNEVLRISRAFGLRILSNKTCLHISWIFVCFNNSPGWGT